MKTLFVTGTALVVTAVPTFAAETYTLTSVTDEVSAAKVAIIAAVGIPAGAGMLLMATKFGGKWLIKVMKSFAS